MSDKQPALSQCRDNGVPCHASRPDSGDFVDWTELDIMNERAPPAK